MKKIRLITAAILCCLCFAITADAQTFRSMAKGVETLRGPLLSQGVKGYRNSEQEIRRKIGSNVSRLPVRQPMTPASNSSLLTKQLKVKKTLPAFHAPEMIQPAIRLSDIRPASAVTTAATETTE